MLRSMINVTARSQHCSSKPQESRHDLGSTAAAREYTTAGSSGAQHSAAGSSRAREDSAAAAAVAREHSAAAATTTMSTQQHLMRTQQPEQLVRTRQQLGSTQRPPAESPTHRCLTRGVRLFWCGKEPLCSGAAALSLVPTTRLRHVSLQPESCSCTNRRSPCGAAAQRQRPGSHCVARPHRPVHWQALGSLGSAAQAQAQAQAQESPLLPLLSAPSPAYIYDQCQRQRAASVLRIPSCEFRLWTESVIADSVQGLCPDGIRQTHSVLRIPSRTVSCGLTRGSNRSGARTTRRRSTRDLGRMCNWTEAFVMEFMIEKVEEFKRIGVKERKATIVDD
jgi:hypothetical protein